MKHSLVYTLLGFIALGSLYVAMTAYGQSNGRDEVWQPIYKHDRQGNPLAGSKPALIQAIRRGYPVRIGWGGRTRANRNNIIEHVAEPVFLTILNQNEVFVQVHSHGSELVDFDKPGITFRDNLPWVWRGLMGTDGLFHAYRWNPVNGELVPYPLQHARITWFVQIPAGGLRLHGPKNLFDNQDFEKETP